MNQGRPVFELRARPDNRFTFLGYALLVTDVLGRVRGEGIEGFYVENTRVLSRLFVELDGVRIAPFAASGTNPGEFLSYTLVSASDSVPEDSVYVETRSRLVDDMLSTTVVVSNWSLDAKAAVDLRVVIGTDFGDIEDIEADRTKDRFEASATWDEGGQAIELRSGHPQLHHGVDVEIESCPVALGWADGALEARVEVAARESWTLRLTATPRFDRSSGDRRAQDLMARVAGLRDVHDALRVEAPAVRTTNATVARAWQAAIEDLVTLPLGLQTGPATPTAGVPIFQQLFGRDSLTIAGQAAMVMPTVVRDTLLTNAAWLGRDVDDWRDEEPGKVVHQARLGPLSLVGENPFDRYYGDYTAPADFLMALGLYALWTNDIATVRSLLPSARAVLDWFTDFGDPDGDGFLEYETRSSMGVKQQGWRDSFDAIVEPDGTVVEPPIATSDVQGYRYSGLRLAALVFALCGERRRAVELVREARALRTRFHDAFWMEDEQFYAMAIGPDGRLVRSISSNSGHLLAAGIVAPELGPVVARRLMQPDLFSGWGIRTLSADHPYYNPFSYHRGSVWPVENGTFALGLARYGCVAELHRLAEAIFTSTDLFAGNRLPELLGGIAADDDHCHPGVFPTSNQPQGWSSSSVVLTVQALLGVRPMAPLGVMFVDPQLPEWLPDLRLDGIRLGDGVVDLEAWRTRRGTTTWRARHRSGARVRVLQQPTPVASGARVGRRLAGLAVSVVRNRRA